MENERDVYDQLQAMNRKTSIGTVLSLLLIVATLLLFGFAGAFGLIGVAVVIPVIICTARSQKKYTAYFKEKVVRGILEEVFDNLTFTPGSGIAESVIESTGMMYTGNRFSSNDLITGQYNGVDVVQSDVLIEDETTDSDGNTSTTTLFCGRWMIFQFNKTFRCDMQVASKGFFSAKHRNGLFVKKQDRLHKAETENEEFNKQFRIYAQDEHETFYLLTPHMMEALLKLRQAVNAPIMLMFVGGVLHVAVQNNQDAFEAKTFRKLDLAKERERILADIRVITDFVDEMSLDRDIYKYEIN